MVSLFSYSSYGSGVCSLVGLNSLSKYIVTYQVCRMFLSFHSHRWGSGWPCSGVRNQIRTRRDDSRYCTRQLLGSQRLNNMIKQSLVFIFSGTDDTMCSRLWDSQYSSESSARVWCLWRVVQTLYSFIFFIFSERLFLLTFRCSARLQYSAGYRKPRRFQKRQKNCNMLYSGVSQFKCIIFFTKFNVCLDNNSSNFPARERRIRPVSTTLRSRYELVLVSRHTTPNCYRHTALVSNIGIHYKYLILLAATGYP